VPNPEPARSYKVLVVEDEGLIAHDIAGRLEALGHEVVGIAATAEEAIAQAAQAEIILMDIRIDGARDGVDAALEIRKLYGLPVIFLTAHADRATLERAKQAGPFGYIVKPLGPASLQTGIEMAIAKHQVERLLEQREAWLRAVLASVADAVVVTTPGGRIRLLNHAGERLTGWTEAEAADEPVHKIVRLAEGGDEGFDPVPLALLRDAPFDLGRRCRLHARDGRELEVEGSAAPVRVAGETLGAVLTFRDASAAHWEERQLQQSQRLEAAARLAAGAAAEYTHLIGVIRARSERLIDQFAGYSSALSTLEEIHNAAAAADRITRRLALLGSRQATHPETFSLNGLLRRLSRVIESAAADGTQIGMRLSPRAGQIRADVAQTEAAVMNLVTHACKTLADSPAHPPQLQIETSPADLPGGEYVSLTLTYSAAEPDIDRLFDPESPSEAGIALAMVHAAVAECGGYLSARPGPNGGSRIEMLIPRARTQGLLPEPVPHRIPTVLFVDPHDLVRLDLHNYFEAAGYNLIEAADSDEAIALGEMREGDLDLVIADASMAPRILEALRRANPALQALRIVDTEPGPQEIRRPFTRQTLLEKVSAMMSARMASAVE